MNNWKIRISNTIITDAGLNHKAFYLYANMKILSKGNKEFYTYKDELMELLGWGKNTTLKKYLLELKKAKIIYYDFNNFPINMPLKFQFLVDEKEYYTQVNVETIEKVKICSQQVDMNVKETSTNKKSDLRELGLRLFYLYEMYYNKAKGYAYPTYKTIREQINTTPRYISALNNTFQEYNLVNVIQGKRYEKSNRRMHNKYIPNWNREG